MEIVYKKLTEKELDTVIKMRIDQLTEEYTSEGRTVPEDVDLNAALLEFYKKNMAAGTYVSWLAIDKDADDKIIGTSGMSFAEKPPYFTCPSGKLGILSSMYTDPDYRRLGIATELLDRVLKEAKVVTSNGIIAGNNLKDIIGKTFKKDMPDYSYHIIVACFFVIT